MIAGRHDIVCQQGAVFNMLIEINEPDLDSDPTGQTYQPFDLRGHSARMQVRRMAESDTVLLNLNTSPDKNQLAGLVLNPNATEPFPYQYFNQIQIFIPHSATASVQSNGVYDMEIINEDGYVSRLLEGKFTLLRNVTR